MAFAPSKGKKHLKKQQEGLSLNSMMDMMTIILLFLLKTMSTSGALLKPNPYVDLPFAQRDMEPKKELSILLRPDGVFEDMEKDPRVISTLEEISNPDNSILPTLEGYLLDHKDFADQLGTVFKGEITIQCDKSVPYDFLLKVINTCGQTEYSTIDFVIRKTTS